MERLCSMRDMLTHIMSFLWEEEKHHLCLGLRIKIVSTHAEFKYTDFIPFLHDYNRATLTRLSLIEMDLSYLHDLTAYNLHSLTMVVREGQSIYDLDVLHQLPLEHLSLTYTPHYLDDVFTLGDMSPFRRLKQLELSHVALTLSDQPLTKLHLTWCHVGGLPHVTLTDLTLSQCRSLDLQPLDRTWFKTISKCKLHQLTLHKIDIPKRARFPRTLTHLSVKQCSYANYNFLVRLTLKSLYFTGSHLNVLRSWLDTSRLEQLTLHRVRLDNADRFICPTLHSLHVERVIVPHILHLFDANLTHVSITHLGYSDVQLDLTPLRLDMTELSLTKVKVDLDAIARLTNLTKLSLTRISLPDLTFMTYLQQLRDVSLDGCDIINLEPIAGLALTRLSLQYNPITDETVVHLRDMPLRDLNVDHTRVTDAGLIHLKRLPLHRLVVGSITGSGLHDLMGVPLKELKFEPSKFDSAYKSLLHTFPSEVIAPLPYLLQNLF